MLSNGDASRQRLPILPINGRLKNGRRGAERADLGGEYHFPLLENYVKNLSPSDAIRTTNEAPNSRLLLPIFGKKIYKYLQKISAYLCTNPYKNTYIFFLLNKPINPQMLITQDYQIIIDNLRGLWYYQNKGRLVNNLKI